MSVSNVIREDIESFEIKLLKENCYIDYVIRFQ